MSIVKNDNGSFHGLIKLLLFLDDEFLDLQNTFMEKNCMHFTDDDENKFIYMDLFNAYVSYHIAD